MIDVRGKALDRTSRHVGYVNFRADKYSYLNITSLGTDLVEGGSECGLACLEAPSCFSYNLAALADINGKLLCELLPSDKYNNSGQFFTSLLFHHFSIAVRRNSIFFILEVTTR